MRWTSFFPDLGGPRSDPRSLPPKDEDGNVSHKTNNCENAERNGIACTGIPRNDGVGDTEGGEILEAVLDD